MITFVSSHGGCKGIQKCRAWLQHVFTTERLSLMAVCNAAHGQPLPRAAQENIYRNFGMPQPNGYRKALRFMKHADKFGFPIVTFVDTPGAYAGKNAEELGQGEVRSTDRVHRLQSERNHATPCCDRPCIRA